MGMGSARRHCSHNPRRVIATRIKPATRPPVRDEVDSGTRKRLNRTRRYLPLSHFIFAFLLLLLDLGQRSEGLCLSSGSL